MNLDLVPGNLSHDELEGDVSATSSRVSLETMDRNSSQMTHVWVVDLRSRASQTVE